MILFFKKSPKITLVLINVTLLIVLFGIIELTLRLNAPFNIVTIGHRHSKNANQYGWGFSPGETLRILDPDTGEIYISSANNHGWRDIDRQYDNPNNAYRILVLGDSNTYGGIVPAHKVYTRLLEIKLKNNGYNAEVINIAYGGWATDQQLEALVNEGVQYKPNLVIVQFCINDLTDNAFYYYAVNKKKKYNLHKNRKPFYYELDQNNLLHKRKNPYFNKTESKTLKNRIKNIISYSEILKRIYAVYLHYGLREQPNIKDSVNKDAKLSIKYKVTDNQLIKLQTVIGLSKDSKLYKFLHDHKGMSLSLEDLINAIETSKFSNNRKTICSILEDRWFQRYLAPNSYMPSYFDTESYEWKLYLALMVEIKKQANLINSDVAIFIETEEGAYQWHLNWHGVSGDERSKINYLSHIEAIKSVMKEKGIDVIENTIPYQRARNDPHPNVEGNQSMANDIWKYLMLHKDKLEEFKTLKRKIDRMSETNQNIILQANKPG